MITAQRSTITEAIIDLRTAPSSKLSIESLKKYCQEIGDQYPVQNEQFSLELSKRKEDPQVIQEFIVKSDENAQVLRVSTKGFSFSKLAPYHGWQPFRTEAVRLWSTFGEVAGSARIWRISIRYINRLELPLGKNIQDFLNIYPDCRPPMPEGLDGFFLRVQMSHAELHAVSLLSLTTVHAERDDHTGLLLDFDLFSTEIEEPSNVWGLLDTLHEKQVELFNASLTPKMKELLRGEDHDDN